MRRFNRASRCVVIALLTCLSLTTGVSAQELTVRTPAAASSASTLQAATTLEPASAPLQDGWWKLSSSFDANLPRTSRFSLGQAEPGSARTWSKAGKIMTFVGIAVAGVGAAMMASGSTTEIGDTGTAIDWKTTGGVWLAGGSVLAIIGLTRRN